MCLAGGQEKIAGVTAADFDDIGLGAKAGDVFGENDLSRRHECEDGFRSRGVLFGGKGDLTIRSPAEVSTRRCRRGGELVFREREIQTMPSFIRPASLIIF